MSLKFNRVLITGGAGFIGSSLANVLLSKQIDVVILDNLINGNKSNLNSTQNLIFINQDIRHNLNLIFDKYDFDFIIHFAALGSVPRSVINPKETFDVNVSGTVNLLEYSKIFKIPIIFASSSSVYGNSNNDVKFENQILKPSSPYGASKASAELLINSYSITYGVPHLILRFFNVFGPRQLIGDSYSAVIPKFIRSISQNEPITIYGDGHQTRNFTFINDLTTILYKILINDTTVSGTFNMCFDFSISINELANLLFTFMNKSKKIKFEISRVGDIKHSRGDSTKLLKLFPKFTQTNFENALNQTIDFYLNEK